MPNWTFDEASHIYTVNGLVIPSVTRVLDFCGFTDFANVRADILERRSRLGQHVHRCCHFYDEGNLDWMSVHEDAKGYVDSWRLLCQDLNPKWRQIEFQCVSEIDGMPVGMRPDREGLISGEEAIVDLKISRNVEPWHGVQTAGYALGLPHEKFSSPMAKFMARNRFIAKLNERGKMARLIPFEKRDEADAFRGGLCVSHWKLAHGRKIEPLELEEAA